ncbi:hypothetical protein HYC85_011204 [Camellia sinensis]|uniref:Pentatricopeptide repeat-containing protein n=1 Tax=Camellia sinensis TaxID=4442 RepID=A0A7J7HK40_CAMSI|nr:hypothetical protein HYC85_011204 [Camellia sinensis]
MNGSWWEVEHRILHLHHGCKTRTQLTQIHAHFLRHHLHQSNQILCHFISICFSLHRISYANLIFHQTHNPNIFLFNSMIKGHSLSKPFQNSLQFFTIMKSRGIWPNEFTFAPLIKSCSNLLDLKMGQGLHKKVISVGFESFSSIRIGIVELKMSERSVVSWNVMISSLARSGHARKNVVSWNAIISDLAFNGKGELGVDLFEEMLSKDVKPNDATFVGVLACCAHAGLVQQGLDLFASMTTKHQIEPKLEHYGSMVDLLGRSGCVKGAHDLIRTMPMHPNATIWGALLSACCTHDNMELAESAVNEHIDLGP